jgi:ADP-ribose pyrophosphatase YjhB (NUDIX family)
MKLSPYEKDYKFCPTCKTTLIIKFIDGKNRLHCENCNFTFWNSPKPVVSIILYNQKNEIFMIKRATQPLKGYWCLPGGHMYYEESPQEALRREVKEESDLDIAIDSLLGVYQIDNDPRGNNIDIIFVGKPSGNIKLGNEDNAYKFFPVDDLPENIAYKHRNAIIDWKLKYL